MKGSIKTKLDKEANVRDCFMCRECDRINYLETHHIVEGIEELNNLITLCHVCHKRCHNMAGCFRKGYDGRRDLSNLAKGHWKGQPFRGNQFRFADGSLRSPLA